MSAKGVVVLACGGRDFDDLGTVWSNLDVLHHFRGIRLLIEGGAAGADLLASQWATANNVPSKRFAADWKKHGRAAGPIRNRQMLDEGKPDLVVAFPGGRGTADMVRAAQEAGIEVMDVR
jgi:hypothetical protein